jgi:hypothetical protein
VVSCRCVSFGGTVVVSAPSDNAEGARLPKLRLGVLHHQGRTLVHEGVSRARGRLEVRRLRYDGHGLALASRGQALRLRRPRKLRLALPLCSGVRGETVWKIGLGPEIGVPKAAKRGRKSPDRPLFAAEEARSRGLGLFSKQFRNRNSRLLFVKLRC